MTSSPSSGKICLKGVEKKNMLTLFHNKLIFNWDLSHLGWKYEKHSL